MNISCNFETFGPTPQNCLNTSYVTAKVNEKNNFWIVSIAVASAVYFCMLVGVVIWICVSKPPPGTEENVDIEMNNLRRNDEQALLYADN